MTESQNIIWNISDYLELSHGTTHDDHLGANQVIASLRHVEPNIEAISLPTPCEQTAPTHINTFADGCFTDPRHQAFSISGTGVWHQHEITNTPDAPQTAHTHFA